MRWKKIAQKGDRYGTQTTYQLTLDFMETIKWILTKLEGKKTSIGIALGAIITYCFAKGWIGESETTLLYAILGAFGLSANVAKARLGVGK